MVSPPACLSTSELCSALNQLPDWNPGCLTPLKRLNPRVQSNTEKLIGQPAPVSREEFEVVIMIKVVTEEMHGSDRVS
jgi:hypothetical protein